MLICRPHKSLKAQSKEDILVVAPILGSTCAPEDHEGQILDMNQCGALVTNEEIEFLRRHEADSQKLQISRPSCFDADCPAALTSTVYTPESKL